MRPTPASRHVRGRIGCGNANVRLVWGGFCQGGAARVLTIFLSVSFFVRPGSRFFIPTYTSASPARAEAGKDGRVSAHRRLVLEGFEHDGTLERVGMTRSASRRQSVGARRQC